MYKSHYSRSISADPERLHFAAHSHHPWPDASREGQIRYWDDSARLLDDKWGYIFSEIVPEAQRNISSLLNTSRPGDISFAPATHDFVIRILSSFPAGEKLRVLTTDSEFYSFARQIARYAELPEVQVTQIPLQPYQTFEERFLAAARGDFKLIYVSQIFFNCGFLFRDIARLPDAVKSPTTVIILDGYHSFMALPLNLNSIADRIFFTAGGYKYAQSGEGCCFLHPPRNCDMRPLNTGWFASFGVLESKQLSSTQVPFSNDGFRFYGATFDPSGVYRFNAVQRWMMKNQLSIQKIDDYVKELQRYFLAKLESSGTLRREDLLFNSLDTHGHFFAFLTPSAKALKDGLHKQKVITDVRGDLLRFGFGLYQDKADIDLLFKRLEAL